MVLLFYLALMALAAAVTLRTQMCVCVCERDTELIGVSHQQAREVVPFGNDMVPEVQ